MHFGFLLTSFFQVIHEFVWAVHALIYLTSSSLFTTTKHVYLFWTLGSLPQKTSPFLPLIFFYLIVIVEVLRCYLV